MKTIILYRSDFIGDKFFDQLCAMLDIKPLNGTEEQGYEDGDPVETVQIVVHSAEAID